MICLLWDGLESSCRRSRKESFYLSLLVVSTFSHMAGFTETVHKDDFGNIRVKMGVGSIEILDLTSRVIAKDTQGLDSLELCFVTLDE